MSYSAPIDTDDKCLYAYGIYDTYQNNILKRISAYVTYILILYIGTKTLNILDIYDTCH